MDKVQALALAERIRQQFPFHHVTACERASGHSWFIGIRLRADAEHSLIVQDERDWERILFALQLLKD